MLKTHHCALSSTVCNIVGFKMSMKSHCCQKIIRSNIRQSPKNSSKKLSKMTNDFWIGPFFNTFISIFTTLSSTVCYIVGFKVSMKSHCCQKNHPLNRLAITRKLFKMTNDFGLAYSSTHSSSSVLH